MRVRLNAYIDETIRRPFTVTVSLPQNTSDRERVKAKDCMPTVPLHADRSLSVLSLRQFSKIAEIM